MSIHNARAGLTPLQIRLADERMARQRRLSPQAPRKIEVEITVEPAAAPVAPAVSVPPPAAKEPWFFVVAEIGPPSIRTIIKAVLERYPRVRHQDIFSQRRHADIVRPRQVAMYLARQLTTLSMPVIGRQFYGRDHTTVLHACRKIDRLIKFDPVLAAEIAELTAVLNPLYES